MAAPAATSLTTKDQGKTMLQEIKTFANYTVATAFFGLGSIFLLQLVTG